MTVSYGVLVAVMHEGDVVCSPLFVCRAGCGGRRESVEEAVEKKISHVVVSHEADARACLVT